MTKKPKPKTPPDTRPQRERFIEAARKSGADESGDAFARAMSVIAPPKKSKKNITRKASPLVVS